MRRDPMKVAVLAYDNLCTFEFGIAVELFGLCRPEFDTWYSMKVCAENPGRVRCVGGFHIDVQHGLRVIDNAGTIVIPGWRGSNGFDVPTTIVKKLQRAYADGATILTVCSGVFALAATGLLDGRRATTHWLYANTLAERYPAIEVDPDVLYVDEGRLLTSAGSAAGIDMGLYWIRRGHGAAVANQVARRMVVPPHRDGGQRQFIATPIARAQTKGMEPEAGVADLLDYIRQSISAPHSVASMARRLHQSPRTFVRRFKESTGTTPHRWLMRERVLHAQTLLETTSLPLYLIAKRSGFSDPQLLRLHFRRELGTPPMTYRKSFR